MTSDTFLIIYYAWFFYTGYLWIKNEPNKTAKSMILLLLFGGFYTTYWYLTGYQKAKANRLRSEEDAKRAQSPFILDEPPMAQSPQPTPEKTPTEVNPKPKGFLLDDEP